MIRKGWSRADLHVHSKYSNRPSEWFLRRIGAPESFAEPRVIYETCRNRGMDFVTISDHNCIDGALEIADLPGVFLSSEITTYFPEDGCKIHCLVSGIDEPVFRAIQDVRKDIYELRAFLCEHDVVHTIAHPLFRVNDRLTADHFEKLLLLFDRFELINGARQPRAAVLMRAILDGLTPALMEEMAARHGIEPGPDAARKFLTGGSDDHGSLYIAGAYTETPFAATAGQFVEFLRNGDHRPGGRSGTSLRLARSIYHIAYSYYRDRFLDDGATQDRSILGVILRRLAGEETPPPARRSRFRSALARRVVWAARKRKLSDIERLLVEEFRSVVDSGIPAAGRNGGRKRRTGERAVADEPSPDHHFEVTCTFAHELTYRFLRECIAQARAGHLISSLQSFAAIGPVILGIAPYLTAFAAQHKDEGFLREVACRFPSARHLRVKSGRKAWVTDTLNDINGVSHTIDVLSSLARRRGKDITVVTSLEEPPETEYPLRNFEPAGTFSLPEYESQTIVLPPFLEMLAYFEEQAFDEVIISTPGPMGLAALAVASLLAIPAKGIYHTDIPHYVQQLTDDDSLGEMTWKYIQWFYGRMDTIFVQSQFSLEQLAEHGFEPRKMRVLGKGVDLDLFNPDRRDPGFWRSFGFDAGFTFLYVGRISREKNLDPMFQAFERFTADTDGVVLVVVGDGPALEDFRARYDRPDVVFTGFLSGKDLATAYASADAFLFPSLTDTYGNVVLEAHASGLPAIVANQGGPPEIVASHNSGLAVDARTPGPILEAMRTLHTDSALRERMRRHALEKARESRWEIPLQTLC